MEGRRSGDQAEKGTCSSQTQPGPPSSMTAPEGAPDKPCTKVVLPDVPPDVTTDHLVNFLECLEGINCSVKDVQQGKRSVVVAFDEPVDVAELQKACSENKLENCVLKVQKADTRGAVVIHNPHPDTKTDCFKFYLQNTKRSGGSKVLDVHRDENNRFLIAYYASEDVAKQVAEKSHELECQKLQLKLYDPNLDVPPSSAEDSSVTSSTDPDPDPDTEKLQDTKLQIKTVVEGLHTVYLNVLDAFSELISHQFYGIQVTTDDTCVTIEGEQHAVETVEKLLHILLCKQKTSSYIKEVADKFDGWEDVFSDIQEDIDRELYCLVLQEGLVDGCTAEELCIRSTYDDQLGIMSFDQFLESHVSKEKVAVETKSAVELLSTTVWDEFAENDVEEKYGKKIQLFYDDNGSNRNVLVLGSVALLEDACHSVKLFLQNTPGTCCIQLCPKEADFFNTFCTSVLERLQCGTGLDNAEISSEGEYINIKGCRVGVRRAEKELNKIREKFRCKRAIFSHPELATIVQSDMWDQMVQSVSAECRCVITSLPDPQIPDADEDGEDWGMWSATVLHSFTFEEQLQCHLVEGKGEDLKVDAVILCHKGRSVPSFQQHRPPPVPTSTQGQGEGARPKTSVNSREHQPLTQNGYIHVTQSGALPCKALIHVDLEHYFSQDKSAPVKASMKILMADVFHECKHHHFTSLAVPVIGVDETWDRPVPIDEASEAIVSCFIDLEDRGGIDQAWKESNLRDVFLCSGRAACLRGLTYFLHGSNETEMPVPAPHRKSFEFLSSPAPKGSGKVPPKDSITNTTGDISKAQADVLIVPLDIDIDLDLNKSKVTRSLSHQGGPCVQHTVKHESSWGFDYDATPKRNEELAEKHVLVGSAGSLRASYIFYVFLPPWGPGVKQVLTSRVHKCLQKACAKHCKRVAMTALGTGSLGYPPKFVARTMLSAVADFMEQERITLENVNIVIFPADQDSLKAFSQEHIEWQKHRVFAHDDSVDWQPPAPPHHTGYTSHSSGHRSYADVAGGSEGRGRHRGRRGVRGRGRNSHNRRSSPHSHHHTAELVYPNPYSQMAGKCSSWVRIQQIKLCVKIGDITHEKCDIVVNSINDEFDFDRGGVSRAFKRECSDLLISICNQKDKKKKMKKKGHVITLAPGLANCNRILHLDLARFMEKPQETIKNCLTAALDNNTKCRSVAFPALGTGASRASRPEQLVDHVVQAIRDLKKLKNLDEVHLIASNRNLFVHLAARMHELVPSHPSNLPVKSQQHKPSQPADTAPKDMTGHPEPAPPQASSVIVKGYSSDLTNGSAVSLFIFSSTEEDRQSATDEIAARIEEMLGPAKTDRSRKNDGQMAEGNRRDHGDREAPYGLRFFKFPFS